jgi:hypothetical protein
MNEMNDNSALNESDTNTSAVNEYDLNASELNASDLNASDPDVSIYNSLFGQNQDQEQDQEHEQDPEPEDDQVDVEIMTHIKMYTEKLPPNYQNAEFKQIGELVQQYLKKYCRHCIVQDEIDIDPDVSRTIYYCSKCFCTF